MSVSNQAVLDRFESLVKAGIFASQVANRSFDMLATLRAYPATVMQLGKERAEHRLVESMRQHADEARGAIFAASIESTALGVLALAKARKGSLVDITRRHPWRKCSIIQDCHHRFILENPANLSLDTWSPSGEIDLKAVVFEVGCTLSGTAMTSMTLVLPVWGRSGMNIPSGMLAYLRFYASGYSRGETYSFPHPSLKGEGVNPKLALQYILEVPRLNPLPLGVDDIGTIDIIGFPGAKDYFATHLPRLGGYFAALAT